MRIHTCAVKKSRACPNSSHGHLPVTWMFVDKALPGRYSHRNPRVTHRPNGLVRVRTAEPAMGLTMTRRHPGSARTGRRWAHPQDREILRLAVPAFLALVAEPLFLLS